jgi:MFS family permease
MSFAEVARPHRGSLSSTVPPKARPFRVVRCRPREDLRASLSDGVGVSAMIGIGETYIAAFALALGTGETIAGLVATLPMLAGATLQLATPWFLSRTSSYKRWVVLTASMQATALLAMPLAAWLGGAASTWWIFLAAACYWAAGQATGPAWNTWIEEIVPRRLRANFFAYRSRVCQTATLLGFVAGGIALETGKQNGWLLASFTAIFCVGASCRYLSAWFLSRQSEPSRGRYQVRPVPLREIVGERRSGRGMSLVLYLLAMQTAVQISGPYFAPYMLGQQKLSYVSFMILVGLGYLGKVIAMPLWGKVAHTAGPRRLLWIGGTSIVPIAALWLGADLFRSTTPSAPLQIASLALPIHVSAEMIYLGGIQLLSGIVWAAYELAMLLMFFEAIPRQDRTCVITYYNFGNSAAQVIGGLIGAAILQLGHESHAAYMAVFAGSSLVRLATVPLLRRNALPPPVNEIAVPSTSFAAKAA